MSSTYVRSLPAEQTRRSRRAQCISLLGPATVAAGVIWAVIQPYRLTLLHPGGQGFWWLVTEPPLLVMAAGAFFAIVIARPLLVDLAELER
jgi:hypothetical protein